MNESQARPPQAEQGSAFFRWTEAAEATAHAGAGDKLQESRPGGGAAQADFGPLNLPCLIGRLHRRYLDVLRSELTRQQVTDISASQVMMLITIGADEISVRHLIERGYYIGSNASYNLKHLVAAGYVSRTPLPRDRRSAILKLTEKGRALCAAIGGADVSCQRLLAQHLGDDAELTRTSRVLQLLERAWSDMLKYRGALE